jgi:hypothetical protein
LKLGPSEVEYSEGKEYSILLIEDNMEIRAFLKTSFLKIMKL